MISREDYTNSHNLTTEQQVFQAEFKRDGVYPIRLGKKRRKLLSLALVPMHFAQGNYRRGRAVGGTELDPQCPFVAGSQLGIVTLADHPAKFPNAWHFIETRVLVNEGFIDDGGGVCIGGMRDACKLRADFSKGPLNKGQEAITVDQMPGELCSPRNGRLRIRRVGKFYDFCVGRDGSEPITVFRLACDLFEGSKSTCTVAVAMTDKALPAYGEVVELDDVQKGEALVTFRKRGQVIQARLDDAGNPVYQWPPGRILAACKTGLFKVLNLMMQKQNDATLLPAEERDLPVDPSEWAFGAFVAFERGTRTLVDNEETKVDIDPFEITSIPGFQITTALKRDFMEAIGPRGEFHLTADHSGKIVKIEPMDQSPHMTRIVFENADGIMKEQLVPSTAVLQRVTADKSLVPLAVGGDSFEGMRLGDVVPRERYASWELVEEVLKGNLYWMLEEFMFTRSITYGDYGWNGTEVLHDVRYVSSVLDYAATGSDGGPRWYWDLRKAMNFFDPKLGSIVLPPVRYDDWDQMSVNLHGVQLDLNDPFIPAHLRDSNVEEPAAAKKAVKQGPKVAA